MGGEWSPSESDNGEGYDGDPHNRGIECGTCNPTMNGGWRSRHQNGEQHTMPKLKDDTDKKLQINKNSPLVDVFQRGGEHEGNRQPEGASEHHDVDGV